MNAASDGDGLAEVRSLPRSSRLLAEWPLTVVLGGVLLALLTIGLDHFRRGAVLLSAAAVLAFFLRLLLPDRDAGMLAVRSKQVDLVVLAGLGLALTLFTFWVPPPN